MDWTAEAARAALPLGGAVGGGLSPEQTVQLKQRLDFVELVEKAKAQSVKSN